MFVVMLTIASAVVVTFILSALYTYMGFALIPLPDIIPHAIIIQSASGRRSGHGHSHTAEHRRARATVQASSSQFGQRETRTTRRSTVTTDVMSFETNNVTGPSSSSFARPSTPMSRRATTAAATTASKSRARRISEVSSNASETPSNLSRADLERLKRVLDTADTDSRRTDYTYSHSATYRRQTPPSIDNPKMSRKALHGPEVDLKSNASHGSSSASSGASLMTWLGLNHLWRSRGVTVDGSPLAKATMSNNAGGAEGRNANGDVALRSTAATNAYASPAFAAAADGGVFVNGGGRVSRVTRSSVVREMTFSDDDDEADGVVGRRQMMASSSGDGARTPQQFSVVWTLFSAVYYFVTTLATAVSYPARRLVSLYDASSSASAKTASWSETNSVTSSWAHANGGKRNKKDSRRGVLCCAYWPCCCLLALLPLLVLLALGKDQSQAAASHYLLPIPMIILNKTRDVVGGVNLTELRQYVTLPKRSDQLPLFSASSSDSDGVAALTARVDRLMAEYAALSDSCCRPPVDVAAFGFAKQTHLDQSVSALSSQLDALTSRLDALAAADDGGAETSQQRFAAAALHTDQIKQQLTDTTSRLELALAALEQRVTDDRQLFEQQQHATAGIDASLSDEQQLKLAQLATMVAEMRARMDGLVDARERSDQQSLASKEADQAAMRDRVEELRVEFSSKQTSIAEEWKLQLAAILGSFNSKEQELESIKQSLLALEQTQTVGMDELRALITALKLQYDATITVIGSGGGGLSESEVNALIALALSRYDTDKTGLVDHALESAGGSVISTRCSKTFAHRTRRESVYGIPLWYSTYSPRTVIQRTSGVMLSPGECWAFEGNVGFLVIKLAGVTQVEAFSYEHIHQSVSPDAHLESAPKTIELLGLQSEFDLLPVSLGNFTYDTQGNALQTFPIQIHLEPRSTVLVRLSFFCRYSNRI